MGQLFNRVNRLIKSEVNYGTNLYSVNDFEIGSLQKHCIQDELEQLHRSIADAVSSQERIEKQYCEAQNEISKYDRDARLAIKKGDEKLAKQALNRKKNFTELASTLESSLQRQMSQIKDLMQLERRISKTQNQIQGAKKQTPTTSLSKSYDKDFADLVQFVVDIDDEMRDFAIALTEVLGHEKLLGTQEFNSPVDSDLEALKKQLDQL
jgi:phage shock protein A